MRFFFSLHFLNRDSQCANSTGRFNLFDILLWWLLNKLPKVLPFIVLSKSVITPFRLFFHSSSFGRPRFPNVLCLYPSVKSVLFELKEARNSSEWLCYSSRCCESQLVSIHVLYKILWLFGAPPWRMTLPFCWKTEHLNYRITFHKSLKYYVIMMKLSRSKHKLLCKLYFDKVTK